MWDYPNVQQTINRVLSESVLFNRNIILVGKMYNNSNFNENLRDLFICVWKSRSNFLINISPVLIINLIQASFGIVLVLCCPKLIICVWIHTSFHRWGRLLSNLIHSSFWNHQCISVITLILLSKLQPADTQRAREAVIKFISDRVKWQTKNETQEEKQPKYWRTKTVDYNRVFFFHRQRE